MGLFDFLKDDKCIFEDMNDTEYPQHCEDCHLNVADNLCTDDDKKLHEKKVSDEPWWKCW